MCGIFGILAPNPISLSDDHIARLRDLMSHRGPDAAGLWRNGPCILAHRRLIVLDSSPAAAQPMVRAGTIPGQDRYALVYNGELYNDAELRADLAREGARFTTTSDTETILEALKHWGPSALARFRGMYALAFYDALTRTLLLARDPLGIKPLYYRLGPTADGHSLIFASEPRPILEHPDIPARPDWITISAYLTTIRTVLGDRTLFEGLRTLRPGESIEFQSVDGAVTPRRTTRREIQFTDLATSHSSSSSSSACSSAPSAPLREILSDSITRHLRSDVPLCCMLSGGLDSSIIAALAASQLPDLHTYCSGAENADDFTFARLMSARLSTHHTEAPITRELFTARWPELIARQGLPLSTPNEIAINEIARRMRAAGHIVTLSGEGADELFGGYDIPMLEAARFEGLLPKDPEAAWLRPGVRHGGDFQLASNAWIQPDDKSTILAPHTWRSAEHDDTLRNFYREEFDAVALAPLSSSSPRSGEELLQPHLRFHRRINLQGLLARLDSATMLEGIEGRTPFADIAIAALAESLPMSDKFHGAAATPSPALAFAASSSDSPFPASSPATSPRPPRLSVKSLHVHTKRILRDSFPDLPPEILTRPKSSFPLPMDWLSAHAHSLRHSPFARELFTLPARETIAAHPGHWSLAWPMINLAMWGDHWWS